MYIRLQELKKKIIKLEIFQSRNFQNIILDIIPSIFSDPVYLDSL